jgi:DNA-binding transcriptional ArsR family regulator
MGASSRNPDRCLDSYIREWQYREVVTIAPEARADPFEVLAEPNRRRILDLLQGAERPVGELVTALALSQPAVSKHLRVLRQAGMVEVRRDAQRRLYRVRATPLHAIDDWPARIAMWESSSTISSASSRPCPTIRHRNGER